MEILFVKVCELLYQMYKKLNFIKKKKFKIISRLCLILTVYSLRNRFCGNFIVISRSQKLLQLEYEIRLSSHCTSDLYLYSQFPNKCIR